MVMNKITERLKRCYEKIRVGGRSLAGSLKERFGKTGMWIPVGLAIACCIICVTLFAVTRNMDTPVSLRSPLSNVHNDTEHSVYRSSLRTAPVFVIRPCV